MVDGKIQVTEAWIHTRETAGKQDPSMKAEIRAGKPIL